MIRKRKGKYIVLSKKGRKLGEYRSRKKALKRIRQVEYFKSRKRK